MKFKVFVLLILVASLVAGYFHGKRENERRLKLAKLSFEYGCYVEAQTACDNLEEEDRNDCLQEALNKCPEQADQYRAWLEHKPGNAPSLELFSTAFRREL